MKAVVLILSLLLLRLAIYAQDKEVIDFNYKKLNIPPVTSLDISNRFFFFSSDNLSWFSTKQGLTSFDGIECRSFYPDTSNSQKFGLTKIMAMVEDKSKNFWIAGWTSDNFPSLVYFNTKSKSISSITSDKTGKPLNEKWIKELYLDSDGMLWMTTFENSFFLYNTIDSTVDNYILPGTKSESEGNWMKGICISPDYNNKGEMWISYDGSFFIFNSQTKIIQKKYDFKETNFFHKLPFIVGYMDMVNDSTILIGTEYYGMGIYDVKKNEIEMYPPYMVDSSESPPYPIVQDGYLYLSMISVTRKSDNEVYLYFTDSLPLIFNLHTRKYSVMNIPGISVAIKKGLAKLLTDKNGDLWIGESKYLSVVSNQFNLFRSRESPDINPLSKLNMVQSVIWDNKGKNYFATLQGHSEVFLLDNDFRYFKKIETGIHRQTNGIILALDSARNLWALSVGNSYLKIHRGLSVCLATKNRFTPIERVYPSLSLLNSATNLITDKRGNLVFSKPNGDLYLLDINTMKLDSATFPEIDSSRQFKRIYHSFGYDSVNDCVYTSNGKNFYQFDLKRKALKIFYWDSILPFKREDLLSMSLDGSGRLWFSVQNGKKNEFLIFDPETFTYLNKVVIKDQRIENSKNVGLMCGPEPYMFVLHEEGTILYNYKDSSFRSFDKDNGLLYDFIRTTKFENQTYISGHSNTIQFAGFDELISLSNQRIPRINGLSVYYKKATIYPEINDNHVYLSFRKNSISISFSAIEYLFPERIQYAFRLTGQDMNWRYSNYKSREIIYSNLPHGKYVFQLKAQLVGGNWQQSPVELFITIAPPFWKTWWFRITGVLLLTGIAYLMIQNRIAAVRKKEQQKTLHEKELLELEAKALRAQMNPHFIFNSLNSIKALINKNENDKATSYLTTFSKLIRTLFHHSDKREVSLFEELETCRLYTQLEKMRFGDKLEFLFDVDENIDLKDIKVPALVLQPFIENSIWHGLMHKKEGGRVEVSVRAKDGDVECIIDDDGVGREVSKKYQASYSSTHQSKGVGLTQLRLELDKILNEREDSIQIFDKQDDVGQPTGTCVIITFKKIFK